MKQGLALPDGTKVFGVGLMKTGTSSLGEAYHRLGLKHCGDRPKLLRQVAAGDFAQFWEIVESYDAFEDDPWHMTYREVALRYPLAKFVPTTRRDPETWYRSVVKEMERQGPTPAMRIVFGSAWPRFRRDLYIKRYLQHNAAVRQYFSGTDQLLEICWETGSQVQDLAAFLNVNGIGTETPWVHRGDTARVEAKYWARNLIRYPIISVFGHDPKLHENVDDGPSSPGAPVAAGARSRAAEHTGARSQLVTIVIPCFNASAFIAKTLRSVQDQLFDSWRVVVVDDGSTDSSGEIVNDFSARDRRIQLIRAHNGGVAAARSLGAKSADPATTHLLFLDADDILEESFLQEMIDHLAANPTAGLVYCDRVFIDPHGVQMGPPLTAPRYVRKGLRIRELARSVPLTPMDAVVSRFTALPSSCLVRRDVFERIPGWRDERTLGLSHVMAEDKDFVMQVALVSQVHYLDRPLLKYRRHSGQRTTSLDPGGYRELSERWWNDPTLTGDQRRRVRHAIVTDRFVDLVLALSAAREALGRRDLGGLRTTSHSLLRKLGGLLLVRFIALRRR